MKNSYNMDYVDFDQSFMDIVSGPNGPIEKSWRSDILLEYDGSLWIQKWNGNWTQVCQEILGGFIIYVY